MRPLLVTASYPSSSPKPRVPTKAPPCRGGDPSVHRVPVGQTLMHGRPIASSACRVIYALSRNGNDAAVCGGKMKKSSKIFNSFTALRDLLGHWG